MKTKLCLTASAALLLTACSSQLTDVNHKWCPPEQPVVEAPIQYEEISLSADALFKFGKHKKEDLLEAGRRSLNELADKLNAGYAKIYGIKLTGHTDRLGSEKANYKLGLNRAETVKSYLKDYGLHQPIEVASAGESQPVTTNCVGNKATKALTECLQPDRRVTVEISGVKKGK